MADSFGDRVAAAVARTGPLCAASIRRPRCWPSGGCGTTPRVCAPFVPRASRVRRRRQRGQAAGRLLRAPWLGRHGGTGAAHRRGDGRRPHRHRRRQAGRHRLDGGGLRRRLAGRRQPAGRRCRDGPPLSRPGRAGAPGPAGRGQREGGPGGGPELEPRGPGPPAGGHRRRAGGRGHAPGRDRRAERLRRGPDAERSARSSGPRWSRRPSRCPSSEGLFWLRGWAPRVPAPRIWRPVSPGAGPDRCCRAAPAGS